MKKLQLFRRKPAHLLLVLIEILTQDCAELLAVIRLHRAAAHANQLHGNAAHLGNIRVNDDALALCAFLFKLVA